MMDGMYAQSGLNLSFQLDSVHYDVNDYGSTNYGLDSIGYQNGSGSDPGSQGSQDSMEGFKLNLVNVLKIFAMVLVMVLAVFGNALVIISVFKFERLRIIANSFIVSLAFADLLVAICVMPFNASQEIAGKWLFGPIMCDIFNANDVLFSTASLLHLCCISMDRYIAILDPFHYESRMTKRRVVIMLMAAWGASSLISHIPIQMGWYTTQLQRETLQQNTDVCNFLVNKVYAAISSCISFWIPVSIMVFTYVKIFREARRQEKAIYQLTKQAGQSLDRLATNGTAGNNNGVHNSNHSANKLDLPDQVRRSSSNTRLSQDRKKMKREHKAAKTLGIIMGAFLCCWLPFFIWYLVENMCDVCQAPELFIKFLFWVGYFNSALNPIIYAFFSRDFRNAFKRLLHMQNFHFCSSCCCCLTYSSCRKCGSEKDALARYGATEMHGRSAGGRNADYTHSSSTPSPRSRKFYDTVATV